MLKLKFLLLSCFIFHAYNSYGVTRDGDSLVVIAPSKELELWDFKYEQWVEWAAD